MSSYLNRSSSPLNPKTAQFIDKWIEDYDKEERGKGTHLDEVIKLTKPTLEAEFIGKKDMYTQKQLRIPQLKENIEKYNIAIKYFTTAKTVKVEDFRKQRVGDAARLRTFLEKEHYHDPYHQGIIGVSLYPDESLQKVYDILDPFIYRHRGTALRTEILKILTSDYQNLGNGKVGISENLEKIKDELSDIEGELSNSNPDRRVFNEKKKEYEQNLKEYEEEKSTKVKELKKKLLEMLTNASCRISPYQARFICSDNRDNNLYDSEYDYIINIKDKNPIENILKNLDIDSLRSLKEAAAARAAIHASILKKLGTQPVKPRERRVQTGQFESHMNYPSKAEYEMYEKARRNWTEKISNLTDEEKKVVEEDPDRYKLEKYEETTKRYSSSENGGNSRHQLYGHRYEKPTKLYSSSGSGNNSGHQLYGHRGYEEPTQRYSSSGNGTGSGHQLYGHGGGTRKHRRPSKRTRRLSSRPNPLHHRR